ncbi:MAG: adenylate/guanylate cyclase domain-containing protein [Phaeodactylibacter sp.]|nr:adenylate/guanylate cyclase domain-containing protein [Phaeodactylibacter sp.]
MITPRTKRFFKRLLPFGLIWLFSGWLFLSIEYAATAGFDEVLTSAIQMNGQIFVMASLAVMVAGFFTGYIELRYLDPWLGHLHFSRRLVLKLLAYFCIFFIIILVTFPIVASLEMNVGVFSPEVWKRYTLYLTSITHVSTTLQLGTSLLLSLFYSEISEFIGQNVLNNFFTGRYHQPVEEDRIFMFLDMKSSTAIAEKLGHKEYFRLLKAYYDCFSAAIIDHGGEIYQYVGDEIILSWKYKRSQKDNRPIDCFFAMRESLRTKSLWFKQNFDIVPTFKAGIHLGSVTTGEIGTIKKEILFSGDVLNATARIQGLCNSYGVDLIVSEEMLRQINIRSNDEVEKLGEARLRGREASANLFTIQRTFMKPVQTNSRWIPAVAML